MNLNDVPGELKSPMIELLLAAADDKLMLGHRASDWTGLGPVLEEDIAFSAIAQEEIAHAGALYEFIAPLMGTTADEIAFGRKASEYRCASLVELDDDFDWARALVRQLFCDHLDAVRFECLSRSTLLPLAALAGRIRAEEGTHVEHANVWTARLGKGNEDSAKRMQAAIDALSPHALALFEPTEGMDELVAADVYPQGKDVFRKWRINLEGALADGGLRIQLSEVPPAVVGGRHGRHFTGFEALLDEMCAVYRVEPGAAW